jgi:hypothetical protein
MNRAEYVDNVTEHLMGLFLAGEPSDPEADDLTFTEIGYRPTHVDPAAREKFREIVSAFLTPTVVAWIERSGNKPLETATFIRCTKIAPPQLAAEFRPRGWSDEETASAATGVRLTGPFPRLVAVTEPSFAVRLA